MLPDDGPSGVGIRVAVLDTGIDLNHPDFKTVDSVHSQTLASLSVDIVDRCYHGTHVAGVIAGVGAASGGRYRGIAPSAQLIIIKISVRGTGHEGTVAAAIEAAIDAKADIINYSAGYSPRSKQGPPPWVWPARPSASEDMFELAARQGVLCVVAAGNDGPDEGSINRPGGIAGVLTVGAIGVHGAILGISSRGPYRVLDTLPSGGVRRFDPLLDRDAAKIAKPDLAAPGEGVVAPRASEAILIDDTDLLDPMDPGSRYIKVTGTSQATAVVTGVAACLLQVVREHSVDLGPNPGAALKSLLVLSARPLSAGNKYDFGAGVLKWPIVLQTLRDYVTDDSFRTIVLNGPQIKLLPEDDP